MKNHKICSVVFCVVLLVVAKQSVADYGEGFLLVRCDSKSGIFEVEPRIIWNEELKGLQTVLKKGHGRTKRNDVQILDVKRLNSKVEESCTLSGAQLKVIVSTQYDPKLQLFENNNLIAAPKIDDVWSFYGFVFKIRYTSSEGWKELCGREESKNKQWQSFDRKRADTNCREPIKAPSNTLQPPRKTAYG